MILRGGRRNCVVIEVLDMLESISRVQVYYENDINMDYDIEWFNLTTLNVTYVFRLFVQSESKPFGFRNV